MSRRKRAKRIKPKTLDDLLKHTKKRLRTRHNIEINRQDYIKMNAMIKTGQAEFIKENHSRTQWYIDWDDKKLRVVYNRRLSGICTVLPPEIQ